MSGFRSSIMTIAVFLNFGILVFATTPPVLTTLQPGQREIEQNLQINIVFVGFEPGTGTLDVNEPAFRADLPATYRSVNRLPVIRYHSPAGPKFNYSSNLKPRRPMSGGRGRSGDLSTVWTRGGAWD